MFEVNNQNDVFDALKSKQFSFTNNSYLKNIQPSYRRGINNQRKILDDNNLHKNFIFNFRHPESGSIVYESHALSNYRPLIKNNFKDLVKGKLKKALKFLHPYKYAEKDWLQWNFEQFKRSNFGYSNYYESILDIGNPLILSSPSGFKWNLRWIRYLYFRERLFSVFTKDLNDISSIIDLGGCYGGFISLLAKSLPNKSYTLLDLGENIPLAAYYIVKSLKGFKINVVNSQSDVINKEPKVINLIPAHYFQNISKLNFDLFCNYLSLGEMSRLQFTEYINSKLYQESKYKHIVNRFVSSPYYSKGLFNSFSNNMNLFDYKLEGEIKYFDIFPFHHFTPIQESINKSPISSQFLSLNSIIKPWTRGVVSSQQFECILANKL